MKRILSILPVVLLVSFSLTAQVIDYCVCRRLPVDDLSPAFSAGFEVIRSDMPRLADLSSPDLRSLIDEIDGLLAGISRGDFEVESEYKDCLNLFRKLAIERFDFVGGSVEDVSMMYQTGKPTEDEASGGAGFDPNPYSATIGNPAEDIDDEIMPVVVSNPFKSEPKRTNPVSNYPQFTGDVKEEVERRINEVRNESDSLRDEIIMLNQRQILLSVAVFDSMKSYQDRITSLSSRIDTMRLDSIRYERQIGILSDTLNMYIGRNAMLNKEIESLWQTIDENIEALNLLSKDNDSLKLVISQQKRRLMFKENQLAHIAPYSLTKSYYRLSFRGMGRIDNDEVGSTKTAGFSSCALELKKSICSAIKASEPFV
jgi:hypothetical protein